MMSPTSLSPILGDATAELSAELTLGAVVDIYGRSYYGVESTRSTLLVSNINSPLSIMHSNLFIRESKLLIGNITYK